MEIRAELPRSGTDTRYALFSLWINYQSADCRVGSNKPLHSALSS